MTYTYIHTYIHTHECIEIVVVMMTRKFSLVCDWCCNHDTYIHTYECIEIVVVMMTRKFSLVCDWCCNHGQVYCKDTVCVCVCLHIYIYIYIYVYEREISTRVHAGKHRAMYDTTSPHLYVNTSVCNNITPPPPARIEARGFPPWGC